MNALDLFKERFREECGIECPTISQVGDTIVYTKHCTKNKEPYSVVISVEEYNRININREMTQNVLSHRSIGERDFIITGFTPAELNSLVDDVDDEEPFIN
jgi:hypothetical protein